MEKEPSTKSSATLLGILSLGIALLMFLFILNWIFNITQYQKFEGFALLITPFISPIGFIFGIISVKLHPNKCGKWGIISNIGLFLLPFLYWFLGTLIFGP